MLVIELMARYSLFFFLFTFSVTAQRYTDSKVDSLIVNGINKIFEENYKAAENLFIELDKKYPTLPFGKIFLASTKILVSNDYKIDLNEDELEELFDQAEEIIDNYKEKNGKNIWYNYFVALVNGYKSYYSIEQKDYLTGMFDGIESIRSFEECLEIDKNFTDSYVVIGNYLYWKSKKTEFIDWFPFVEDNTKQGISLLERAVKESVYSRKLAIYTLMWIYINEKRYDDAVKLSKIILDHYPDNRFVKRALASAYYYIDIDKSIKILSEIKSSLMNDGVLNDRNKITLDYRIAKLNKELNRIEKSKEICNKIINEYSSKNKLDSVVEKRLEMTKDLLKEINQKK